MSSNVCFANSPEVRPEYREDIKKTVIDTFLYSIIIPMYNAEPFIENCIDSVLHQNIPPSDYEIIVVNDGSTDNSPKIVKGFVAKHSNIKLINQPNGGHGAARNTGLAHATGKHIYFLDADDYVLQNGLGLAFALAKENNLDILVLDSLYVKGHSIFQEEKSWPNFQIVSITTGLDYIGQNDFRPEVWRYIIKRDFLVSTNLRFYDRKFVQDAFYTPSLFIKAKKVTYLPIKIHRYTLSDNSITRKKDNHHYRTHIDDTLFSIGKLHQMIHDLKNDDPISIKAIQRLKDKKYRCAFFIFTRIVKSDFSHVDIRKIKADLKSKDAFPIKKFTYYDYHKIFYKLLTFIFNHNICLFPAIWTYHKLRN